MTHVTTTYDDAEWQLVPRKATHDMLMDLKPKAGEIVKVIKEDGGKRLNFSCDFALAYRLLLASAPACANDMQAFSASEAACYQWPEDTAEHKALRAAYIGGAASIGADHR